MKAETKLIPATRQYILTLNKEEAKYITALLNCAPASVSKLLDMEEYTSSEISRIEKHGCTDGMCRTLRNVIYGEGK